ncbi:MAG TPA: hypothetical protein VGM03_03790 [Phycisphaerae bacterium]|jgi:hypothetical protein
MPTPERTAKLIDELISHVTKYLDWHLRYQLALAELPRYVQSRRNATAKRALRCSWRSNGARNEITRCVGALAPNLERYGYDASGILKLKILAAEGYGGADAVAPIWPDLKVSLQRMAIRLRGIATERVEAREPTATKPHRRGRPKGTHKRDLQRDARIAAAWASGAYPDYEALARELGDPEIDKLEVAAAVDNEAKRAKRRPK